MLGANLFLGEKVSKWNHPFLKREYFVAKKIKNKKKIYIYMKKFEFFLKKIIN